MAKLTIPVVVKESVAIPYLLKELKDLIEEYGYFIPCPRLEAIIDKYEKGNENE